MKLWGLQKASNWCLRSSDMLWSVGYYFVTDVSLQHIGSDMFFRNVGKQLPLYNAKFPRRAKTLTAPQRKSQISRETCNILSKWISISCPRRIKVRVVNQQRKELHSTCRTQVSLDGYCSEIRFQTFHFEVGILRCQKIRTAYYNVPILQREGNVRVHLWKNGVVVCRKRGSPILATLQVV